jgi:hypothetical protein
MKIIDVVVSPIISSDDEELVASPSLVSPLYDSFQ